MSTNIWVYIRDTVYISKSSVHQSSVNYIKQHSLQFMAWEKSYINQSPLIGNDTVHILSLLFVMLLHHARKMQLAFCANECALSSTSRRQLQVLFNLQPSSTARRSAALSSFTAARATTWLSATLLYCCGCPWVNFMYIQILNANTSLLS